MTDPTPIPQLLEHAFRELARTVSGLSDGDLEAASLLPGWTRKHVLAHLALNAEGLERVLRGLRTGEPRTMYDSNEARDADIEQLAHTSPPVLRTRLDDAAAAFEVALAKMTDEDGAATFDRTPGGQVIRAGAIPLMRWREVEIHHVDLDASYSPADWPRDFRVALIDSMTHREYAEAFEVHASDLGRRWQLGAGGGGPVVTGDSGALGWWLTGRGDARDLDVTNGSLPRIEPW